MKTVCRFDEADPASEARAARAEQSADEGDIDRAGPEEGVDDGRADADPDPDPSAGS